MATQAEILAAEEAVRDARDTLAAAEKTLAGMVEDNWGVNIGDRILLTVNDRKRGSYEVEAEVVSFDYFGHPRTHKIRDDGSVGTVGAWMIGYLTDPIPPRNWRLRPATPEGADR